MPNALWTCRISGAPSRPSFDLVFFRTLPKTFRRSVNKFKKHTHNKEIKNKGVHITVFQYPVVGFLMICHKHFQMQNYKLIQHKQDDNKIQTKCFIYFKESVLWLF